MTASGLTRRRVLGATAATLVALHAPRALAHRAHVVLTRVTANSAAKRWEFEHSIHYHDAALALLQWTRDAAITPATIQGRARLLLEIERRVRWTDARGEVLQPSAVGGESTGDTVVLFQELPTPQTGGDFAVESKLLQDVFAEESHTINLELAPPYRTFKLDARSNKVVFPVA